MPRGIVEVEALTRRSGARADMRDGRETRVTLMAAIATDRFGYGLRQTEPAPADPPRFLLDQLDRFDPRPATLATAPDTNAGVALLVDYRARLRAVRKAAGEGGPDKAALHKVRADTKHAARRIYERQATARLAVAVAGPTPFAERLVHFWSNHFATSADKSEMGALSGSLEFEAIRPHLNGRFVDMLVAVETHPAMLVFLDQARSIGPTSPFASGAKRPPGINENLAREIMELHTLGVHGGYTQADVTEFARALTGWTVPALSQARLLDSLHGDARVQTTGFVAKLHEPGARTVLGRSVPDTGGDQALAILHSLAEHSATADHLSLKLARHFVADEPPPALVSRLSATFRATGGDLPSLHRALVTAPEAWAGGATKFKTPWDWTVSALRVTGSDPAAIQPALLDQLGQPTWKPGSPAGWDDVAASWAGPDALWRRVEAASRLAERVTSPDPRQVAARAVRPGSPVLAAVARADSAGQGIALLLSSPEFMRR